MSALQVPPPQPAAWVVVAVKASKTAPQQHSVPAAHVSHGGPPIDAASVAQTTGTTGTFTSSGSAAFAPQPAEPVLPVRSVTSALHHENRPKPSQAACAGAIESQMLEALPVDFTELTHVVQKLHVQLFGERVTYLTNKTHRDDIRMLAVCLQLQMHAKVHCGHKAFYVFLTALPLFALILFCSGLSATGSTTLVRQNRALAAQGLPAFQPFPTNIAHVMVICLAPTVTSLFAPCSVLDDARKVKFNASDHPTCTYCHRELVFYGYQEKRKHSCHRTTCVALLQSQAKSGDLIPCVSPFIQHQPALNTWFGLFPPAPLDDVLKFLVHASPCSIPLLVTQPSAMQFISKANVDPTTIQCMYNMV